MPYCTHASIPLATAFVLAMSASGVSAGTTVNVEFWDKGADLVMAKGFAYAAPMPDMSTAPMGMRLSPKSAPAGDVVFDVINRSKDTTHEMLVVPLRDASKPLPYMDKENRVDEDKVGSLGEVPELDPGKSGSLTLTLQPGKYLLLCNVPGHFASGMWTTFEVTK